MPMMGVAPGGQKKTPSPSVGADETFEERNEKKAIRKTKVYFLLHSISLINYFSSVFFLPLFLFSSSFSYTSFSFLDFSFSHLEFGFSGQREGVLSLKNTWEIDRRGVSPLTRQPPASLVGLWEVPRRLDSS